MITSLKKAVSWIDTHLLVIMAGFLLAFIPLYPKLPLFEAIPGYIVRVRLEDLFVLTTAFVWLIQVIRGKVKWRTPMVWFIAAYAIVGILSLLSGIFLINTIPPELLHVGKSALHYFRYLEYFTLFLIVFSAIKSRTHVIVLLSIFSLTLIALSLYGYGQRYYYWPVYSTMNREFSKGIRLYLTEHARVQSTFGGHYDLAAYLVIALPIVLTLAFAAKKWWLKVGLQITHWMGVWLMIMTASRTSFLAYGVGALLVLLLWALQQKGIPGKVWWGVSRSLFVGAMVFVLMANYGDDMYERFLQTLEGYPQAHAFYHYWNGRKNVTLETYVYNPLIALNPFRLPEAQKPENSMSTDELEDVMVASDQRPEPIQPSDVYVNVNDIVDVASTSADGTVTVIQVDRGPRTYSDAALKHGLSLAIRLDTLWPQAIRGFMRNPIVGSGYATLNKESAYQFTEADSTDNNFLRTLGETGLLGFITFYGAVILALRVAFKQLRHHDLLNRALSVGVIGATIGLLINAIYIDVFAASKVAFAYWSMIGLLMGYVYYLKTLPPPVKLEPKKMAASYRKPSVRKVRKNLTFHE